MTLILALPATDGVVFGSDSQLTAGEVRSRGTKIFQLNDRALWGASGEIALIQRVAERIDRFPGRVQPLSAIRDPLSQIIKESMEQMLTLDFRTQFFSKDPGALLSLHPGDFLFVEYRDNKPLVLHIMTDGTAEWVEHRFTASGNGSLFAHALLHKYTGRKLPCDKAKLLAYKVIQEAIEVGAYGLGPPIDIWRVQAGGIKHTTEDEVAALEDSASLLRGREVEMLTSDGTPPVLPAQTPSPDGARPPEAESIAIAKPA